MFPFRIQLAQFELLDRNFSLKKSELAVLDVGVSEVASFDFP